MKTITAIILLSISLAQANACTLDPSEQISQSPDAFMEEADIVFFGRIVQLYEEEQSHQTAVLEVDEVFKGPWARSIIIQNKQVSSCSRRFQGRGQRFYVFAVIDEETGNYIIDNRGGFVSEGRAKDLSLDIEPNL